MITTRQLTVCEIERSDFDQLSTCTPGVLYQIEETNGKISLCLAGLSIVDNKPAIYRKLETCPSSLSDDCSGEYLLVAFVGGDEPSYHLVAPGEERYTISEAIAMTSDEIEYDDIKDAGLIKENPFDARIADPFVFRLEVFQDEEMLSNYHKSAYYPYRIFQTRKDHTPCRMVYDGGSDYFVVEEPDLDSEKPEYLFGIDRLTSGSGEVVLVSAFESDDGRAVTMPCADGEYIYNGDYDREDSWVLLFKKQ